MAGRPVAKHLAAAGADVTFSTLIGDDDEGRWLIDNVENAGVKVNRISEDNRCTTIKGR